LILVDPLREYPSGHWCHMVSDSSLEELHDFARRLGVHRERFQEQGRLPHYDLRPGARGKALALGAEAVGSKELFRRGREAFLRESTAGGETAIRFPTPDDPGRLPAR
jgi:hypothetical protein